MHKNKTVIGTLLFAASLALTAVWLIQWRAQALSPPREDSQAMGSEESVLEPVYDSRVEAELRQIYRTGLAPLDFIGRLPTDIGEAPSHGVTGSVSTSDGTKVENATIYAYLSGESYSLKQHVIGKCRSDDLGRYILELPHRNKPYRIDLGATSDGLLRNLVEDFVVLPGGSTHDFLLPQGLSISGHVYDSLGTPIRGVKLMAARRKFGGARSSALLTLKSFDTSERLLAPRSSNYHEGRATSLPDGSFVISGLAQGEYALAPGDGEWIWIPPRVSAGESGVGIQARRPLGVRLTVSDADTGELVAQPRAMLTVKTADQEGREYVFFKGGAGIEGDLMIAWNDENGRWAHRGTITATLSAPGYQSTKLVIPYESDRLQEASVSLKRAQKFPLTLDTWLSDGSYCDVPLLIDAASPGPGSARIEVRSEPQGDGRHIAKLPRGRWFLRVRRVTDLGKDFAWHGEIFDAGNGSERHIPDVSLPASASIRLEVPAKLGSQSWLLELRREGFSANIMCSGTSWTITGLRDGMWKVFIPILGATQTLNVNGAQEYGLSF